MKIDSKFLLKEHSTHYYSIEKIVVFGFLKNIREPENGSDDWRLKDPHEDLLQSTKKTEMNRTEQGMI